MNDISFLSAKQLTSLIRRRKLSSLELLDHYIDRIERYNPSLNAIITKDFDQARDSARIADGDIANGVMRGPLHGLPMTVKESFDVAGLPTTWGVPDQRGYKAKTDAVSVQRLRQAGAIIIGKSNVPIWLADCQSFNEIYGITRNPWDENRSPGGSSGGSAASLAAGMTGLELGSDIAGSIRNPAAHCGVFGHKPTMGICSTIGHTLNQNVAPIDMLVIGPLARSAQDLEIGLKVIMGFDDIDSSALRITLPRPRKKQFKEFKISVLIDDNTVPVANEIQEQQQRLVDFLRSSGVSVDVGVRPDFDPWESHRIFDVLLRATTSSRQTDDEFNSNSSQVSQLNPSDDTKWARMLRGLTLSHRDWTTLNESRHRIRWKWHDFFTNYDLMLAPMTVTAAFPHNSTPPYERTILVDEEKQQFMNQISLAGYANLSYLPSTVAPIGFTKENLPVGVQIIGAQYQDRSCIRFARLLEKHYQKFKPSPHYK
tara:strand:+ start:732 stop:2183 length:1452 start_codon:yes stop_codon:yes gene_type:complete